MNENAHREILRFAQRTHALGLSLLEADPVVRLSAVWDVLNELPRCNSDDERVALAVIVRRIAKALFSEQSVEMSVEARLRRTRIRDVHCARALEYIRRNFADPDMDLHAVAQQCRLSTAYLSHLLSARTRYSFQHHLRGIRLLYAAHLLATQPLSVEEVADRSGFKSTSALDHEFKRRVQMTPGEFKRWGA